jgi:transaldolase
MNTLAYCKIKIFADGADLNDMLRVYREGIVTGFTTNPTLMRKSGIADYAAFAQQVLSQITDLPISFEVFSDDLRSMEREARIIAEWGKNVNIKVPITTTDGTKTLPLIKKLSNEGMRLNITAILTVDQVRQVVDVLPQDTQTIISVFAGRIADTGRDPIPVMKEAAAIIRSRPQAQLLWASTRELLNIFQAESAGCHIITVTNDILKKCALIGKDLNELSLETVQMFYRDAQAAGYRL